MKNIKSILTSIFFIFMLLFSLRIAFLPDNKKSKPMTSPVTVKSD